MPVIFDDSDEYEIMKKKKRNGAIRTEIRRKHKEFELSLQAGRTYEYLNSTYRVALRKIQRIRNDAGGTRAVARVLYAAVSRVRYPNTWNETSIGDPFFRLRDFGIDICLNGRNVSIRDAKGAQTYEDDCFFSKTYALLGDLLEDAQLPNPFIVFERKPNSIWKSLFNEKYVGHEGDCHEAQKALAKLRICGDFPTTLPFRLLGGDGTEPRPLALVTKKFVAGVVRRTISLNRLPRKLHTKNIVHTRIDEWTSAKVSDLHYFVYNTALSKNKGRNIYYGGEFSPARKRVFTQHLQYSKPHESEDGLEWLKGLVKRLDSDGFSLLEMCYGFSRTLDLVRPLIDRSENGMPMSEI